MALSVIASKRQI